jgi:hypothetical protein
MIIFLGRSGPAMIGVAGLIIIGCGCGILRLRRRLPNRAIVEPGVGTSRGVGPAVRADSRLPGRWLQTLRRLLRSRLPVTGLDRLIGTGIRLFISGRR